jgi:transposase
VVNIARRVADGLESLQKQVSKWTIKRILKCSGFGWRRVKKSLESQQDPVMHAFFKQEIALLQQEHKEGKIRLVFYDESGFSQNPASVYAWLPQNSAVSLPALRGNVLTVAGFMQSDNTLMAYSHQGSTTSELFIAYVDDFLKNSPCPLKTILILDNASFHKSASVKKRMSEWQKQNLYFQFLPPYCSQLNKIETLWHHIKHLWLKTEDYSSRDSLEKAVLDILRNVKSKYTISFA